MSRTANFTPDAPLDADSSYTARLSTDVTDLAGNAMSEPVTWTFATGQSAPPDAPAVGDSTESGFAAGSTDDTVVRSDGDGAVGLATSGDDLAFDSLRSLADGPHEAPRGAPAARPPSTAAPSPWTGRRCSGHQTSTARSRPGRRSERRRTRTSGSPGDADFNAPWFTFGIGSNPDQVYARSSTGMSVGLGADLLGSPHSYSIEWGPAEVRWYIDGALRHTAPITTSAPLLPAVSDAGTGGPTVTVDSLSTERYVGNGAFTSRTFDAGRTSRWGAVALDADVPSGTTLEVLVRTGDSALPDGTWSGFVTVPSGAVPAVPASRYLQYRLVLGSTDPRVTPLVRQVTFGGP